MNVLINATRSIKSEVPINGDIADLNRGAMLWVSIVMRDEKKTGEMGEGLEGWKGENRAK